LEMGINNNQPPTISYQQPVTSMKKQPATSCQLPARKGENWKLETGSWKLNNGFTFIELIVSVLILGIVVSLGVASYTSFNINQTLNQAAEQLKSGLRLAQSKSFEGVKPDEDCAHLDGWRVNLDGISYDIWPVCDGVEMIESDMSQSFNFPTGVSGPTEELLFLPLSRSIDIDNQLELVLVWEANETKTKTVTVFPGGEIR